MFNTVLKNIITAMLGMSNSVGSLHRKAVSHVFRREITFFKGRVENKFFDFPFPLPHTRACPSLALGR